MIVLHAEPHWVSPYVFACFVTLVEKGLDFETRELDAERAQTLEYLAQTVTGRRPTLVHDDFGVGESSAIVGYLDETFPTPAVLPSTPRERARARQIMSWLRSDATQAMRVERPSSSIFYPTAKPALSADAARAAEKLYDVARRLQLPERAHVFGAWSIVDAEIAFMLQRLVVQGDPVPPPLRSWAESQWQRPCVRAFVEHDRPKVP